MSSNHIQDQSFTTNKDHLKVKNANNKNGNKKIKLNPRKNLTYNKSKKQISWRRRKVKKLLFKGYSQQEISSMLRISQSTISRDMIYLYSQHMEGIDNYGKLIYQNHFDIVNGTTELLKKVWEMFDDPKADFKTKYKIMNFIMECYSKCSSLFEGLPYKASLKQKVEEIEKKEKYFMDNNIQIDYAKPMTMEEFDKSYKENILKQREKEAVF